MGNNANLSQEIISIGFSIVDDVTLLGMIINRDLSTLTSHFDTVLITINRIIEYWDRFKLTLPGRISVCKTFMLSQIGYLGSIITPTIAQINSLQGALNKFCLGSMRVAKKKLYSSPEDGGLGLINIEDYITALQCTWIKRVTQHWGDNWRYDIKKACYGNPLIANSKTFIHTEHQILFNICASFEKFSVIFSRKNENYKKSLILNNPIFKRGRNDNGILCNNFFRLENTFEQLEKIAKLKFEDFFNQAGAPRSLQEINLDFNIDLSLATYMRLHEALQFYVSKLRNIDASKPPQSLEFFF
jgi:hypothetical protein